MDAERTLRDELEVLQGENRALRATLAIEHAPAYLEKLAALQARARALAEALGKAKARLDGVRVARRETEQRIVTVKEALRIEQQRRVGLSVLAVIPTLWFLMGRLHAIGDWTRLLAPACGAAVGLLLAPRMWRWFTRASAPTGPDARAWVVDNGARNVGLLPLAVALVAVLAPAWLLMNRYVASEQPALLVAQLAQGLAALAVLLSVRGQRRADAGLGTNARLAQAAGGLAFFPLLLVTLAGVAALDSSYTEYEFSHWPGGTRHFFLSYAEAASLLVVGPSLFAWRLDAIRSRDARRPWAWPLAAAHVLAASAFVWAPLHRGSFLENPVTYGAASEWSALTTAGWLLLGGALWAVTAWRARRSAPPAVTP